MEANKILQADLLDLLFDGRNKDYGAYELRKKYDKRMSVALGITGALLLAIIGGSVMANSLKGKDHAQVYKQTEVTLTDINEHQTPPPPPPPPPVTPPPQRVATINFTHPVIKDDKLVKDEVPPVDKMINVQIDNTTVDGTPDIGLATPPNVDGGTGVVAPPKQDPDVIFYKVEIEASVDFKQWKRHLESQLQPYMDEASSQGMAPGQYTVQVRFLVERDGSINDVHALNDPGYGLAKGAEDVVRRGPKWNAGEQNGNKVRSYHTQPVTFIVPEQ